MTQPTGIVTLLFADMVNSASLWEAHPEAMAVAHARCISLVNKVCAAHHGTSFTSVGETGYAVFATATDAVAAAIAVQRAIARESWDATDPIRVRIALHTGAVDISNGSYVGLTVNRAVRLLLVGHGGQMLLSRATYEVVQDHLPARSTVRDLGEHRLKDLARPEHIFQLVIPDLPGDFPSLATLDQQHTNLPIQATPFIGRTQEVERVCALLRRPEVRLLTLTGPGGTGKTRLSLQVAAEMLDQFADGVYVVLLASIHDPQLVVTTIAQTLGISEAGSRSMRDLLLDYVRDKQLLLMLDNFEQVVTAAEDIAELLDIAPRLNILVTSRSLLQLYGEYEYRVPPLALPDLKYPTSAQQLTQYEAVALFLLRAQAVKADFHITDENAPAIAEICVRLDGLPLAIELAAARIKILPPQALLIRLSNRLALLTSATRNVPARQQTLRGAIDWSYNLLEPHEQRLFTRLAVFVGGCTVEAAAEVCNAAGDISGEILDVLTSLVDKSLLQQNVGSSEDVRFVMLETIREYALEQLGAQGEVKATQQLYSSYFVSWADTIAQAHQGPQQALVFNRLADEYDNLRAVFAWVLEQEAWEQGLALIRCIYYFWYMRG